MAEQPREAQDGRPQPESQQEPLSRRELIGGALAGMAGLASAEALAAEAKKDPKMPVWSGDLRNADKPKPGIRRASKPNGLNLIVIVADTFRADHLGCYGSTRVKTPNLDALASQSVVFTNAQAEGLPTIPCRRVYHTGKSVLPESKWQPLADSDTTIAEVLGKHGFTTGFIVDTYHHFKPGYNFHRGFDSWEWIRGQETDRFKSGPRDKFDPKKHMPAHLWNPGYDRNMRQYLMNTQDRTGEEDYFCAQSCRAAVDWLERNAGSKPFMLWIDMFDPHEPWDAPPRFQRMYRDQYPFERYLFGYGVRHEDIRPDDLPVIRDLYAADVSFSDHCIGRLIKSIDQMGLTKDTVVVFTTDHGTHLGEESCVQKTPALLNRCVTQIPLMVRHPDDRHAGKRIDGLVSAIDLMPTLLALVGIEDYQEVDGGNFWKMATGQAPAIHEEVYTVFANFGAVHNLQWHYFQNIRGQNRGKGPCLYNLKDDPQQSRNVVKEFPRVAKDLRQKLQNHLGIRIPSV